MRRSVKSSLLSALVFPGAGHVFLKKYLIGTGLAAAAFFALYVVVSKALERVMLIVAKIESGEVQLDVVAIAELVSKQSIGTETQFNIPATVFLVCWIIGVVDSYRVGRSQDRMSSN